MTCGKAQGRNGKPAELFKSLGHTAFNTLTIWDQEDIPTDLRCTTIVTLYKNKRARTDCSNYMNLSSLHNRQDPCPHPPQQTWCQSLTSNLPTIQFGFRFGCNTVYIVFAVRQEKCIEQQMVLSSVFGDLTKAFDSQPGSLMDHSQQPGLPTMVKLFHINMKGQVLSNGDYTNSFNSSNGVKQSCVLAPMLSICSSHKTSSSL